MAKNWTPLQKTADRLITRFGASQTVTETGTTAADPTKPWVGTADDTAHTVDLVRSNYDAIEINGTTVQNGDRKYLLAAYELTFTPKAGDRVVDGSETFEILRVEAIKPGDTAILYTLHTRKGASGNA